MTQTTSQVEAAVQPSEIQQALVTLRAVADWLTSSVCYGSSSPDEPPAPESEFDHRLDQAAAEIANVANRIESSALAGQQEVAAPVTQYQAMPLLGSQWRNVDEGTYLEVLEREGPNRVRKLYEAASRVPVASPAEPVPKLAGSPFESYVAQVIHAAFADGWGSCRDAEFAGDEAMNDAFNQSATLGVCLSIDQRATTPVGAGGAGVMDARPDSVHSDSGECDRVQRVELSGDELALFQRTLDGFADCGETETDYEVLANWAQRGLLECTNFQPTAAAHRMLASITSTDQNGNAV